MFLFLPFSIISQDINISSAQSIYSLALVTNIDCQWFIKILEIYKPRLLVGHMIGGTRINIPHFRFTLTRGYYDLGNEVWDETSCGGSVPLRC